MRIDIERLLQLTADYHFFCSDSAATGNTSLNDDELSLEELDYISAAVGTPMDAPKTRIHSDN